MLPVKRVAYSRVVVLLAVKEGVVPCRCTLLPVNAASGLGSALPWCVILTTDLLGRTALLDNSCSAASVRSRRWVALRNQPSGMQTPIGAPNVKSLKYIGLVVGLASCGGQASQQPEGNRQAVERGTHADSGVRPVGESSATIGETSASVDLDQNACRELGKVPSAALSEAKQSTPMCDSDADCERTFSFTSKVCTTSRCPFPNVGSARYQAALEAAFEDPEVSAKCSELLAGNCFRFTVSCPAPTDRPSYLCTEGECVAQIGPSTSSSSDDTTSSPDVCTEDSDCPADEFCDRGLACVSRFGTASAPAVRGNNCGEGGVPVDLRTDPCGAFYVCYEGLCRSCMSDDECREGYSCAPYEGYGNMCGMPRQGDTSTVPTDVPENP